MSAFDMDLSKDFLAELIGIDERDAVEKDAKKVQKVDDGINCQKMVIEIGPEKWQEISKFGVLSKYLNADGKGGE